MEACIFCQILNKSIPARIVYEDEYVVSFLDVNPRSKGMCLVVPKNHYREFDENFDISINTFRAAFVVSKMIKQALQPKGISMSIIPSDNVPHFHIRVYPVYNDETPLIENQPIPVEESELDALAEKIRSIRVEIKEEKPKEEPKEEEKKAPERTEEEGYWIKREMEIG